jgi:hypothetical protein
MANTLGITVGTLEGVPSLKKIKSAITFLRFSCAKANGGSISNN